MSAPPRIGMIIGYIHFEHLYVLMKVFDSNLSSLINVRMSFFLRINIMQLNQCMSFKHGLADFLGFKLLSISVGTNYKSNKHNICGNSSLATGSCSVGGSAVGCKDC